MSKPLILEKAIEKAKDIEPMFSYDYSKDLNVINTSGQVLAFIDASQNCSEMQTETRVDRERDDCEISFRELLSKTEVDRERDDEESVLSDLMTKTAEDRERDDEESSLFAEYETKTFSNRERDDEDDFTLD